MRLIDADKVVDEMESAISQMNREGKGDLLVDHIFRSVITELKGEPTADAVPVVHGEWENKQVFNIEYTQIEEMQSASCSKCGSFHTTPYLYWFDNFKFCPNCGAKMDGGGENETD